MSERSHNTWRQQVRLLPAHIILLLGGLTMVFPFVWQVMMSLSTNPEIQSVPPQFLPATPQWNNYVDVFARMQCRGRNVLFGLLLAILMIPSQAFLITQYQIVKGMGLLETPWGIVLPGLFSAFGTFLMRQAFMSLPKELEEAARLDGCNPWQVFWKVMLPLTKPSLFAVAITTVLWSWNDLLWPLIVTTRETNMPLSVGIATFAGQHQADWNLMMAASVMAMAPIFALFFAMQRKVIEGLATSGLKG